MQTLKQAKLPRPNTSKQENAAIRQSIHIMSGDKGNATMVMSTMDYDPKVKTSCQQIPTPAKEPHSSHRTHHHHQALHSLSSSSHRQHSYHHLKPSASACPRFYGQPKIHKPDVPLHPIVASRGSPTYYMASKTPHQDPPSTSWPNKTSNQQLKQIR